jgi:hypothetical protein
VSDFAEYADVVDRARNILVEFAVSGIQFKFDRRLSFVLSCQGILSIPKFGL